MEEYVERRYQVTKQKFLSASQSEQKYKKAVLAAAAELSHEFTDHYWIELLQQSNNNTPGGSGSGGGGGGGTDELSQSQQEHQNQTPPSVLVEPLMPKPALDESTSESVMKGFLFFLNASGRYLVLREHLRLAISSLVQQKCLNLHPTGFHNHRDLQAYLHDMYVYLVDEMQEVLNASTLQEVNPLRSGLEPLLQQPCENKQKEYQELSEVSLRDQHIKNLGIYAEEAWAEGDSQTSHRIHLIRTCRDNESARCWTDFALMWLSQGNDRMAEVAVREALQKDPQYLYALIISGVISVMHGDENGLECLGAALGQKPMAPEILVIIAVANSVIGNDAAAEYFFKKAAYVHRVITGHLTSDFDKLFKEKSEQNPFKMKEFISELDKQPQKGEPSEPSEKEPDNGNEEENSGEAEEQTVTSPQEDSSQQLDQKKKGKSKSKGEGLGLDGKSSAERRPPRSSKKSTANIEDLPMDSPKGTGVATPTTPPAPEAEQQEQGKKKKRSSAKPFPLDIAVEEVFVPKSSSNTNVDGTKRKSSLKKSSPREGEGEDEEEEGEDEDEAEEKPEKAPESDSVLHTKFSFTDIQPEEWEMPPLISTIICPWDITQFSEKMQLHLQTVAYLEAPGSPGSRKNSLLNGNVVVYNVVPQDDGVVPDTQLREEYDKLADGKDPKISRNSVGPAGAPNQTSKTAVQARGSHHSPTTAAERRRSSARRVSASGVPPLETKQSSEEVEEKGQGDTVKSRLSNPSGTEIKKESTEITTAETIREEPEMTILTDRLGSELIWAANMLISLRLFEFADAVLAKQLFFYGNRTVQFMYLRALSLYIRQREAEALQLINGAVELDKTCVHYRTLEGHCHYNLGNMDEAIRSYEEALKLPAEPNENRHLLYLRYGCLVFDSSNLKLAKRVFLYGVSKYPTPRMWLGLGLACYHQEEYEQAESALAEANRLDNANPVYWGHLALTSLMQGKKSLAEQAYKWAVRFGLKKGHLLDEIDRLQKERGFGDPSFPRLPNCIPHDYFLRRMGKIKPFNLYKEGLNQQRPKMERERYADTVNERVMRMKLEQMSKSRRTAQNQMLSKDEWGGEGFGFGDGEEENTYFGGMRNAVYSVLGGKSGAAAAGEDAAASPAPTSARSDDGPPDLVTIKTPPPPGSTKSISIAPALVSNNSITQSSQKSFEADSTPGPTVSTPSKKNQNK